MRKRCGNGIVMWNGEAGESVMDELRRFGLRENWQRRGKWKEEIEGVRAMG